jgi:hypothetical protein
VNADCLNYLRLTNDTWNCGFADIPDNLDLGYEGYDDRIPPEQYYSWVELLLRLAIPRCQVFWLSCYHTHLMEIMFRLKVVTLQNPRAVRVYPWRFKFGQYQEADSPNGWRPFIRIASPIWKPIMVERVPSVREKMGDARATGKGRVPDDVFEDCRIQGNNTERREWHPTQIPEAIYRRIAKMSVPDGGSFIDFCAGTGTAFRAITHCNVTGIELSESYCQHILQDARQNIAKLCDEFSVRRQGGVHEAA